MKRTLTAFVLGLALLFGSGGIGYAQDFQKGLTAAQSGDFATALREWTPLAKQGSAGAQYNLGVMEDDGDGFGPGEEVPNPPERARRAHHWLVKVIQSLLFCFVQTMAENSCC